MRRLLPLVDLLVLLGALSCMACGGDAPTPKFRAFLDGNRPAKHLVMPKLDGWLQEPRRAMFMEAVRLADEAWNPQATGDPQTVEVDLDDGTVIFDGENPCTARGYSLWSIYGSNKIYVCAAWQFCRDPKQTKSHYGLGGCVVALLHEGGHLWSGNPKHLAQLGRPLHNAGPIMAGWASDAIDPMLRGYTEEDRALICADGGHGGPCNEP